VNGRRQGDRGSAVLHVIVPQREGAVGGSDLHVIDLSVAQRQHGEWHPVVLAPRASTDYRERLQAAGLDVVEARRLRVRSWMDLPLTASLGLVHGHGYEANYIIAGLRRVSRQWARLPTVVTGHGWIETSAWLRLKSALDRLSARNAHVRVASAAAHAHRFRGGRGTTLVIRNGIPTPDVEVLERLRSARFHVRGALGVPSDAFLVGAVGRLSPEKRIDLLLDAMRQLLAHHPEVYLLVVGGGSEQVSLESLARRLGISGRVAFAGLLRDVSPAYAAMDLMVQAADTEGTPRTVLEAMAHGVPIVATDVGDVRELLDRGAAGVLVPAGDSVALARAIIESIERPDLQRRVSTHASTRCRQLYTIEGMRQQVHAAYQVAQQMAGHP
jgi:glycosyltransferase involved in cell wall biosynthesis